MIRFAVRRPVAIAMVYLGAALLGVAAWRNIPVELLPDTTLPRLHIRAWWTGASPETTEAFLTSPLEAAIQQVRGVEKVSSISREQQGRGEAEITVEFARGTDMDFARLDLSERLAALEGDLPPVIAGPYVEQFVPEALREHERPFLQYTLAGPHTIEALRAHVEHVLAPELRQVDGIAEVVTHGGRGRLLEVQLDPLQLNALGLTPEAVRQHLGDLEFVREVGSIREGGAVRTLTIRQRAGSVTDLLATAILSDLGRVVRLRDVGTIHDTFEDPISYYRVDGLSAVSFELFREQGTNAIAVADRAKARLAELERLHPPGVRMVLDQDESAAIRAQFNDLRSRALLSAAIIFIVLLVFLRSFRSAVVVFATIAFSVLITLNVIYFGGYSLNVLTLMGLAMGFGIIVDTAIVVFENIHRRHGRRGVGGPTGLDESAEVAAERGTREVVLALVVSTLTTVVVFIPFVYLQGELRLYYIPLAVVTVVSQMVALLVSFTFVPAVAARLLGRSSFSRTDQPSTEAGAEGKSDERGAWYVSLYASVLRRTTRYPLATVTVALLLFAGSWYVFDKHVQRGVVWRSWWDNQTYLLVQVSLPRGEELQRTDEIVRYLESAVKRYPEVDRFVTHVHPQSARITITFTDSMEKTAAPLVIKEELTAEGLRFGGAEVRVIGFGPSFYGGGGSAPNYSVGILGYNYETVRNIAEDLGRRFSRFSRIHDVDVNATGRWYDRDKASEVVLRIDRARLGMHDLAADEVVTHVAAAVGGGGGSSRGAGGVITLGGEETRLAVKLTGARGMDVIELEQLALPSRNGGSVRLGDVARVEERNVLGRIVREDQQYRRNVSYEFRGPPKLGDRVLESVLASTAVPDGYRLEGRQEWNWRDEDARQLYGVLAFSLVLVFMVTAALFESMRQPFCVLLTVPMALVGVFLMFWLTGASFTREAYIGVIMMGGIVVNSAVLLIDRVNQLRRDGGLPLVTALEQGTLQRVRPILMTNVSTILALLPIVLFSEYADSNIWNALGFALIGGLTSSTLLVLTVTPALYLLVERRPERARLARLEAV
ncbi:MAG: efflux RND transporter permease subunit [Gemmatimonadaceae bacterium]